MTDHPTPAVIPRQVPEGTVPLIAVEGDARDCGRQYAEIVMRDYSGYRRYFDINWQFRRSLPQVRKLFERRAPYMIDVLLGLTDAAGPPLSDATEPKPQTGCTSFGISGRCTLDGQPISGQTKDTVLESAMLYVVLRMRINSGPTILTLAYPGEIVGYGFWSTGMSLFRNSLHSKADSPSGLTLEQWAPLALAGSSVEEAVELARGHGLAGAGNCLIADPDGQSLSIEFNAGGIGIVPARDGIATHANHPEAEPTAPYEHYADPVERKNSRYRMHGLWELLNAERGRLTPQRAMMALADHRHYPRGICRHLVGDRTDRCTTAAVVAEPTRGRLHVVRSQPCCNWPVTYTL